jgi:hypothetical protein
VIEKGNAGADNVKHRWIPGGNGVVLLYSVHKHLIQA